MKYTLEVEALAKELGISESVAMDIIQLRSYEARVIKAAKANPEVRDFAAFHYDLEKQLEKLEATSEKKVDEDYFRIVWAGNKLYYLCDSPEMVQDRLNLLHSQKPEPFVRVLAPEETYRYGKKV